MEPWACFCERVFDKAQQATADHFVRYIDESQALTSHALKWIANKVRGARFLMWHSKINLRLITNVARFWWRNRQYT